MAAAKLRRHYKHGSSGFNQWDQKDHAQDHLLYPHNLGTHLSLDELSLSKGEIYTYLTNKAARGRRGTLVASIKGTRSTDIAAVLMDIPEAERLGVKEVTLDMAANMAHAARIAFPNAIQTIDHFHVIKLAMEAMQHVRVAHRWLEMDAENAEIKRCRAAGLGYIPTQLSNGDTPKQLLARSRFVLAKARSVWTSDQKERAGLLFERYPNLGLAYGHVMALRKVYANMDAAKAAEALGGWLKKARKGKISQFATVANTIETRSEGILNYFVNRNTNANAESFNAKIKLFRANLRGVSDIPFFLFRMEKLFA